MILVLLYRINDPCEVPQGSVLGLLLFIRHMLSTEHNINFQCFADNTQFYIAVSVSWWLKPILVQWKAFSRQQLEWCGHNTWLSKSLWFAHYMTDQQHESHSTSSFTGRNPPTSLSGLQTTFGHKNTSDTVNDRIPCPEYCFCLDYFYLDFIYMLAHVVKRCFVPFNVFVLQFTLKIQINNSNKLFDDDSEKKFVCMPMYAWCLIRLGSGSYWGRQQRTCHPASLCMLSLAVAHFKVPWLIPLHNRIFSLFDIFGRLWGINELSDRVSKQFTHSDLAPIWLWSAFVCKL